MKMKKMLAIVLSTAISVASLGGVLNTSASGTTYDTYRIYFDASASSGIGTYIGGVSHLKDSYGVHSLGSHIGILGGTLTGSGTAGDTYVYATRTITFSGDLTSAGILFTYSLYTNLDVDNILDGTTAYIGENISKNLADVTLTPNPVVISEVLVGDVNQDGQLTNVDKTLLRNYLYGSTTISGNALRAADTNCDYIVNQADYDALVDYLLGDIDHFDA